MFEEILDSYFRKTPFETGISEIDNLFNRGITKGSLITIAGRQGVGKTSFAISICNHLLEKDMKVRYFELKRCRSLVERQFIYVKSQIEGVGCASEFPCHEWEKITETMAYYDNKETFKLVCKTNITIDEIEQKVKEEQPDVVFIDAVQFLELPQAPDSVEAINIAVKKIKRIAAENNLIVVLIYQLADIKYPISDDLSDVKFSELKDGKLFVKDLSEVLFCIKNAGVYSILDKNNQKQTFLMRNISILKNEFGFDIPCRYVLKNGHFIAEREIEELLEKEEDEKSVNKTKKKSKKK